MVTLTRWLHAGSYSWSDDNVGHFIYDCSENKMMTVNEKIAMGVSKYMMVTEDIQ